MKLSMYELKSLTEIELNEARCLTLLLPVLRCSGDIIDLPSNNNIPKTVGRNIA